MPTNAFEKIVLCDDHYISLLGLESILRKKLNTPVKISLATNGEDALRIFENDQADLVVVDLGLPKMQGLEFIQRIRAISNSCMIFVITANTDQHLLQQTLKSGINALMQKTDAPTNIESAFDFIANNADKIYLDEGMSAILDDCNFIPITKREFEVLNYIVQGLTSPQIADAMNCSLATVKTYRVRIMNKSGTRNTAEMIAWYLKGNSKRNFSSNS